MIILDTNVISALMRAEPEQAVLDWLDRQPSPSIWTTSITVFEIRTGLAVLPLGRRRRQIQQNFEETLGDLNARVIAFDTPAAAEAATLMARRRQSGRVIELRDTMIAGIAIARRATLATRNTRHFDDLPIPVVDPWAA